MISRFASDQALPFRQTSFQSLTGQEGLQVTIFWYNCPIVGVNIEIKINHQLHVVHVKFCYSFAPITPGAMHVIRFLLSTTVSWRDNQSRVD